MRDSLDEVLKIGEVATVSDIATAAESSSYDARFSNWIARIKKAFGIIGLIGSVNSKTRNGKYAQEGVDIPYPRTASSSPYQSTERVWFDVRREIHRVNDGFSKMGHPQPNILGTKGDEVKEVFQGGIPIYRMNLKDRLAVPVNGYNNPQFFDVLKDLGYTIVSNFPK